MAHRAECGRLLKFPPRHHSIYQYLDYTVEDCGGFMRAVRDRQIGGLCNRLVLGAELLNGEFDSEQYVTNGGDNGASPRPLSMSGLICRFTPRTRCSCGRISPSSPGCNPCMRTATVSTASLRTGISQARRVMTCRAPSWALLWDVDPE